jgi:enoyl-CoA hydratase/carnithine racemase
MSPRIAYQRTNDVLTVEIPPLGDETALLDAGSEFAALCEEVVWENEVRAVVLVFDGPGLVAMSPESLQSGTVPSLSETVGSLRQPVIAAIRGDATGPGLELALACDIRLGTEGARFGLPAVAEGSIPSSGGTQRLPRLIGQGKALEMLLTGSVIDAREALRVGLLNRIVAPGDLVARANALAFDIALKSPLAVAYVKEALHKGMDLTLEQGMRMELDLYLLLFGTNDRVEGIRAFQEKRTPFFEGE